MPVALLFIDGVGVGLDDRAINPLSGRGHLLSQFQGDGASTPLPHGGRALQVDACFGVAGRPQSASNQTALLTGLAAPQLIGRHVLGFPDAPLRKLLLEHSIVKQLVAAGRQVTFANAYPAGYLDAIGLAHRPSAKPEVVIPERARRRLRPSATTLAMAAGGVLLRTLDDARAGDALTHDITAERARARGLTAPVRTEDEAGELFWRIAQGHDFTLFEHYLADEAGHAQDRELAERALDTFDAFARAVVARRPHDTHLLVCSDHGNVEDLSTRSHTKNPVPVLHFGPPGEWPALTDLAQVGRFVLELCGVDVARGAA